MALLNQSLRSATPLLAGLALSACERVVTLDLPDVVPRLVVESRIEVAANGGTASRVVRLTQTAGSSVTSAPPATGATVRVRDERGNDFVFVETPAASGIYTHAGAFPLESRTFTLQIVWQGDRYEATDRRPEPRPIEQLSFVPAESFLSTPGSLAAAVDFSDPADEVNFYQWEQFVNGNVVLPIDSLSLGTFAVSDSAFNGTTVRQYAPFSFNGLSRGLRILMRQRTLSPGVGRFLADVQLQSRSDGSPFARPPFNLRGNVVNLTTPSRRALGVFGVTSVWEAQARVP
jgi:hypothetical protein